MSQTYPMYSNLMFTSLERSSPEETDQPAPTYAVAVGEPSFLSGLLATEVLTVNENEALHY